MRSNNSSYGNGNATVRTATGRIQPTKNGRDALTPTLAIELTGPLGDRLTIPLDGNDPLSLGRSVDSAGGDITRYDPHLAKTHALLLPVADGWFLTPEPSVNGVYVRVDGTHQLRPGDAFIMGGTHGRVVVVTDDHRAPESEQVSRQAEVAAPAVEQVTNSSASPTPLVLEVNGVEA